METLPRFNFFKALQTSRFYNALASHFTRKFSELSCFLIAETRFFPTTWAQNYNASLMLVILGPGFYCKASKDFGSNHRLYAF